MENENNDKRIATARKASNGKEVILSTTDFENLIKYIKYLEDKLEKLNSQIKDYNEWESNQLDRDL